MRHAVLLLLILAAGLLFGLMRAAVDAPPPMVETPRSAEPPAAGPTVAASALPMLPERTAAPVEATAAAPVDRAPVTLVLRAIDAETGAVLPHTEIVWDDAATTYRTAPDPELRRRDEEAFLRAVGVLSRTDAQGRLALQVHERLALVARCGDRYVRRYWRPNSPPSVDPRFPGECVLRLRRDLTLSVRAIDGAGAPVADVVVWLLIAARQSVGADNESASPLPPTAADGTTQLHHAQELLGEPNVTAAHLRAQVAGADGPLVPFDPAGFSPEPIDVLVPAFGSVFVELRGPSGEAWRVPGDLRFTMTGLDAAGHPENKAQMLAAVGGRALFPRVALQRRFRLATSGDWVPDVDFDGPTVTGQQVLVPLQMRASARVLTGRVLRPDGEPHRAGLSARLTGERSTSSGDVAVDGGGRFAVRVPAWLGNRFRLVLAATRGPRLEAVAELADEPGIRDLGDLVLMEPPVLVAGSLVWPHGAAPAAAGAIRVEIEQGDSGGVHFWPAGLGADVAADGTFVVRGHAGAHRYRAVVAGPVAPREPVEFAPGTRDLRLEVVPPSCVVATFLVAAGAAGDAWQIKLVPVGNLPRAKPLAPIGLLPFSTSARRRVGERIEITWDGLPAGTWRLSAALPGQPPAAQFDVQVPPGGAATDPRLVDVDLRGSSR